VYFARIAGSLCGNGLRDCFFEPRCQSQKRPDFISDFGIENFGNPSRFRDNCFRSVSNRFLRVCEKSNWRGRRNTGKNAGFAFKRKRFLKSKTITVLRVNFNKKITQRPDGDVVRDFDVFASLRIIGDDALFRLPSKRFLPDDRSNRRL
jgi:hypothetical protein